jgi:glutamyl/glutaminyl-tRNA synthetase
MRTCGGAGGGTDVGVLGVLQERMHGIDSKCRSRSPEETLGIFKEMQQGTERGLTNCLRFKLDMQNPNKALRDPVAFRCNLTPHWRTGDKYKVSLSHSLRNGHKHQQLHWLALVKSRD